MNSNNTPAIIRSLIIYAVCIPLAVCIGYLLAAESEVSHASGGWMWNILALFKTNPIAWGSFALVIFAPLLLRWHHFLLIAGWNLSMTIFFIPGAPPVWLLLTALSLGISVLQRTVNSRAHFLSAPEIARPLLFFFAVILMTAKLTGGIGLHSLGNEVSGGKHYITLIGGILAYFAVTASRIPPKRAALYISLFFLAGFSSVIGDLLPYLPSSLHFIFAFFPVNGYDMDYQLGLSDFHARYAGLGNLGVAGFLFVLSRYGLRGILLSGKLWRVLLLGLFVVCILFGGFRSSVILCGLIFTIQFFMEGLHRTNVMPVFVFAGLMIIALLIPFANKLPYTFQRSLAFLPLKIDLAARLDAESSEGWRLEIWRGTLPKVPQYLLLGKGYAISQSELAMANNQNFAYLSTADLVAISGNYHSGPLSVLMPFGIWGAIALLWFWFASIRALYANLRHGDPAFQTINAFLFAYFVAKILSFLVIFGALEGDLASFVVLIGLSISINGGIRRPLAVTRPMLVKTGPIPQAQPQLQPVYQR